MEFSVFEVFMLVFGAPFIVVALFLMIRKYTKKKQIKS